MLCGNRSNLTLHRPSKEQQQVVLRQALELRQGSALAFVQFIGCHPVMEHGDMKYAAGPGEYAFTKAQAGYRH